MRKNSTALFGILCGLFSLSTLASDGVLNFSGRVEDDGTCRIEVNSKNQTVVLPTVAANSLSTTGRIAGKTPFKIALSQCNVADAGRVLLKMSSAQVSNGVLQNASGSGKARNVGVQIGNLTTNQTLAITSSGVTSREKKAETGVVKNNQVVQPVYDLFAQYYATGRASAGDVSAILNIEVAYP